MQSSRSALKTLAICSSLALQNVSDSMFDISVSMREAEKRVPEAKRLSDFRIRQCYEER